MWFILGLILGLTIGFFLTIEYIKRYSKKKRKDNPHENMTVRNSFMSFVTVKAERIFDVEDQFVTADFVLEQMQEQICKDILKSELIEYQQVNEPGISSITAKAIIHIGVPNK
jgi:uncharacterized protein YneF (UPF0154 family)